MRPAKWPSQNPNVVSFVAFGLLFSNQYVQIVCMASNHPVELVQRSIIEYQTLDLSSLALCNVNEIHILYINPALMEFLFIYLPKTKSFKVLNIITRVAQLESTYYSQDPMINIILLTIHPHKETQYLSVCFSFFFCVCVCFRELK